MKTKTPPLHSCPEKYVNTALLVRSILMRVSNPSWKRSFRIETPPQTGGETNLKMPSLRAFQSGLSEVFLNRNSKWPVIVAFLNFFGVVWTENIWCVFRIKIPFSCFRSGAVRRGPTAGINKCSIRSYKLAYSKRKEITIMEGVDFLQLL